jgi:hypothetical protein
MVEQALTNTDLRIRSNKRVTPAFIYAASIMAIGAKSSLRICKAQGIPPLQL